MDRRAASTVVKVGECKTQTYELSSANYWHFEIVVSNALGSAFVYPRNNSIPSVKYAYHGSRILLEVWSLVE